MIKLTNQLSYEIFLSKSLLYQKRKHEQNKTKSEKY